MKKLFNHTKRPDRNWEEDVQDGYDWDEEEYPGEEAKKALNACIASLTPAATKFIESAYGDLKEYLSNKIEAEVRKQKLSTGIPITSVMESTTDTTAVAASTAAATAASVIQTAISQIDAEAKAPAAE